MINCARSVIAVLHVSLELLIGEQLVFVCKHLLVPRAEIAHLLVVNRAHMAMEVGPAQPGEIAGRIGAVVPK